MSLSPRSMRHWISAVIFGGALLGLAGEAQAAVRSWIGAAGNFSDATRWSTTSGGANDTTAPGSADVATFDGGGMFDELLGWAQGVQGGEAARFGCTQQSRARVGAHEHNLKRAEVNRGCKNQRIVRTEMIFRNQVATPCHVLTGDVHHVQTPAFYVCRDAIHRIGQVRWGQSVLTAMAIQRGVRFCQRDRGDDQCRSQFLVDALDDFRANLGFVPLHNGAGIEEIPHRSSTFLIAHLRDFF